MPRKVVTDECPIHEKLMLSISEAALYSNIGSRTIEAMLNEPGCPFCFRVGKKRLVKRKEFEAYVASNREYIADNGQKE